MERLITDGKPEYGIFEESVRHINHRDFDLRTPMGAPAGRLARHFGYKHFQYLGVLSDSLLAGCGLVDLRTAALIFVYVFEVRTQALLEWTFIAPLSLGLQTHDSPIDGKTIFRRGSTRIEFDNHASPRTKALRVDIGDALHIDASFDETAERFEPMNICTRTGKTGWVYAQKVAGVRAKGSVRCELGTYDLAELGAMAHHDWSGGYMRRETFWNWACLSAEVAGRKLGLNLSCGVNETTYSENCLWVDGRLHPVGGTRFDYDEDDVLAPWRISSLDGQVDLTFEPLGLHTERRNLIVAAGNFKQLFGRFRGTVRLKDTDTVLHVDDATGFAEEQYAKW